MGFTTEVSAKTLAVILIVWLAIAVFLTSIMVVVDYLVERWRERMRNQRDFRKGGCG